MAAETVEIPILWPAEALRVNVLTPYAILSRQASELSRMTKGVLRGEVAKVDQSREIGETELQFDVVAPALGNVRRRIATIVHAKDAVYPATIRELPKRDGFAATEEEFMKLLKDRLQVGDVVSTLQSLIAQSGESSAAKPAPAYVL